MDIVDSQVHIGPGGVDEALAAMDALGIKSILIHEFWVKAATARMPSYTVANGAVRRMTTPTGELASLTHPDRFSYLVPIERHDPEMQNIIRLARDAPYARALRITPGLDKRELAALALGGYDEMFKAAADCGLPIFVTIPGNASALRPAIEKFPAVTFIIDHCGMPFSVAMKNGLAAAGRAEHLPDMGEGSKATEFEKVLRLADLPNAALKWGHAPGLFEVAGYPFEGLRPFLRSALNSFGAERVMWASDITLNRTGESWAQLMFWFMANPDLSSSERAGLLGGAARKCLKWET